MDPIELNEEFLMKNRTELATINPDYVYRPRQGDVIIAGPGKSGTTWLQQILHQIRTKGDESFQDIYDVTWFLHFPLLAKHFNFNNEQVCNPRIYKCHSVYEAAPTAEGVKYFVIVRDPLDSLYSYSKFKVRFFGGKGDLDENKLKEFTERSITSSGVNTIRFITSWWPHHSDPNVFWVHYEDLLKDLRGIIKEMADFIQIPLTEEELSEIYSFCTFDYMATHAEKFKAQPIMELMAQIMDRDKWDVNCSLVRADGGTVGQGMKLRDDLKYLVDVYWREFISYQFRFKDYSELYAVGSRLKESL